MKVGLIAVCHGSYKESLKFLESLDLSLVSSKVELDIFFVENSSQFSEKMVDQIRRAGLNYSLKYIESENLGYFPSAIAAIKSQGIPTCKYDFFIISNVDLVVSQSFFQILQDIPFSETVGVYAPSILSIKNNVDRNPKITVRPTFYKLKMNLLLFSSIPSYALMVLINYLRLKILKFFKLIFNNHSSSKLVNDSKIYAPHGSFILMTKKFFQHNLTLNYPIFLFGEEIYIAEMARSSNLEVKYAPALVINDTEHASTALMNNKDYRSNNINALNYLLQNFKW